MKLAGEMGILLGIDDEITEINDLYLRNKESNIFQYDLFTSKSAQSLANPENEGQVSIISQRLVQSQEEDLQYFRLSLKGNCQER